MTAVVWDAVGEKTYQTGVDRGVLYIPDGAAVPWNGLTNVSEKLSRDVKSYYADGVKYLDKHIPGSYAGKLSAFTYPDELEGILGTEEFAPGVYVHDQRASLFHLTYRTGIGNDTEGMDHGYRVHILYNVMATPSDTSLSTVGEQVAAQVFEWELSGTPESMWGIRPTSHISLDSRRINPDLLEDIEAARASLSRLERLVVHTITKPGTDLTALDASLKESP